MSAESDVTIAGASNASLPCVQRDESVVSRYLDLIGQRKEGTTINRLLPTTPSKWLRNSTLAVIVFCFVSCSTSYQPLTPSKGTASSTASQNAALPGERVWKAGVSSFLFGTNDTYEWSPRNIQTQPAIQQALRNAGFTLIRSFFPDGATDAEIEQRISTIENSNARCLGVITNISHTDFDKHLVRYLGQRCLLYEFGNESDVNGYSIANYLKLWNTTIPLLRAINPQAKFIGPVTYNYRGNHDFMKAFLMGVKASGILPDAISFHMYGCYENTESDCLLRTSEYQQAALAVKGLVKSILGKDLPLGITEWNYDPGNPPPAYGDDPAFITKFTNQALQAMIAGGVNFACQFDAASYAGYGRLDLFDVYTNGAKPQYYAIKTVIAKYRP